MTAAKKMISRVRCPARLDLIDRGRLDDEVYRLPTAVRYIVARHQQFRYNAVNSITPEIGLLCLAVQDIKHQYTLDSI